MLEVGTRCPTRTMWTNRLGALATAEIERSTDALVVSHLQSFIDADLFALENTCRRSWHLQILFVCIWSSRLMALPSSRARHHGASGVTSQEFWVGETFAQQSAASGDAAYNGEESTTASGTLALQMRRRQRCFDKLSMTP